jgi:hypothetical protein
MGRARLRQEDWAGLEATLRIAAGAAEDALILRGVDAGAGEGGAARVLRPGPGPDGFRFEWRAVPSELPAEWIALATDTVLHPPPAPTGARLIRAADGATVGSEASELKWVLDVGSPQASVVRERGASARTDSAGRSSHSGCD